MHMLRYALPHWRGLGSVFVMMLVGVGLDLLKPWPLKLIIDYVLKRQALPEEASFLNSAPGAGSPVGLLAWLAVAFVILVLAQRGAGIAKGLAKTWSGARMVHSLGQTLFGRLQRLSLRFHGQQRAGDLVHRVTKDCSCVRRLIMDVVFPGLTALTLLAGVLSVMWWQLDRSIALLTLLVAPVLFVLARLFNQPMTERSYEHQQMEGQLMAQAEQTLTALPVVQAFGREPREEQRYRELTHQTFGAYMRSLHSQLQFKVGISGTTSVASAAVMVVAGFHVVGGSMTVGDLIVVLSYLGSIYGPMQSMAWLTSDYASASARARRVMQVMQSDDEVPEAPDAKALPARPLGQGAHVVIEAVTFGYEPDRPVLQDVTIEARPGQTIALVGPTGAGKTTVASLIPRFFDPWQGRVLFDGHDVRQLRLANLRQQIALVLQDPFLLPLSVAQNIAYGRPDAAEQEIINAAQAANADEFIEQLPDGYDTVIAERGATLSGGQKQRLAIARALLVDAPVLILDEPTSALDAQTESLLLQALERLMVGRTTFIIAHRLSTIRPADQIVVLDAGRIVENGTHQQLIDAKGLFRRLYDLQHNPDQATTVAARQAGPLATDDWRETGLAGSPG